MTTEQETDRGCFTITQLQRDRIARFVRKSRSNTGMMLDFSIMVLLVLVAIFAPVIASYPIDTTNIEDRSRVLLVEHPLGIDDLDRDISSHVVMGSHVSLYVSLRVISGAPAVGTIVGVVADYVGELIDEILMRVVDTAMAFPSVLLTLTLLVIPGPELSSVVIVLAFVCAPYTARISRNAALIERNEVYVEIAAARGGSDSRVVFSEVFPNCMTPMLVQGSLNISFAIPAEASLSFPGLGAQLPRPSWGLMISTDRGSMQIAPWMLLFPVLAIGIVVVRFNMLGDGLHDIPSPKVEAME